MVEVKKICENCKYFKRGRIVMDCLNDDITEEEYERCLGQNGEDCLYFGEDIEK